VGVTSAIEQAVRLAGQQSQQRFDLARWFSIVALLAGAAVTISASLSLSAFLSQRMIQQEANLTAAFVRTAVASEGAYDYFRQRHTGQTLAVPPLFVHLAQMPDVLRANVFADDATVLWSSDPALIGQRFPGNDELAEALRAELVVHSGVIDRTNPPKSEHRSFDSGVHNFIETYTPIIDPESGRVVGVVEIYRVPDELFAAIRDGHFMIWSGAVLTAIFLYVALSGIIAKAQQVIERQHEQLVEREGLAVVGEMGSAVAHGLRNPLASIRSSAEIALGSELSPDARECAGDIIEQVDRLEGWIRGLLAYTRPAQALLGPVAIEPVLRESVEGYRRELERRDIALALSVEAGLPPIRGEAAVLGQLINSLIANAAEAIQQRGTVLVRATRKAADVQVEVLDDGPGISEPNMAKVFTPFFTTKQKGLGLGLPLVKRVIERFGGAVSVENVAPHGLSVRLTLPVDGARADR
jgi:two-component system sensor histidine kinase HydH